jgi:hypothetical protein
MSMGGGSTFFFRLAEALLPDSYGQSSLAGFVDQANQRCVVWCAGPFDILLLVSHADHKLIYTGMYIGG